MKKNVKIAGLFTLLLLSAGSVKKGNSQPLQDQIVSNAIDLKNEIPASNNDLPGLRSAYPEVFRKLTGKYPLLQNLHYRLRGRNLYLDFKNNEQAVTSVYSVNGKMRYSVVSLGKALPPAMAELVKKEYPGYAVYYSRYVSTRTEKLYHIIIQNDKDYRVLNLTGNEVIEVNSVLK